MLFSKQDIRKIVIPLIIEQILTVTIGMFDSMMVSSAGEAAISGVSLVDSLNLLLCNLFTALATGGAVVVSHYLGKKDDDGATHASKQLIVTITVCASLISILAISLRGPLLNLVFGKIEHDVMANAQVYLLITALSFPFLGLYNAGAAIFRSLGNSKISMTTSLMMNVINISGNALLIFVFKWGAAGAATATLVARICGTIFIHALLRWKNNILHIRGFRKFKPDFATIKKICRIGIPSGIEHSMFQLGKVMTQSLISTFGTVQIAANAVANSLTNLQFVPASAINIAVITIVGRCIGAQEMDQAKHYSRKLLKLAYISIIGVSVVFLPLLNAILSIYQLSSESTEIAKMLIYLHSAFVCTLWPLSFSTPCSFRAAGDVKFSMIVSMISMWGCRVGLSYVFGKFLGLGVTGIWLAMFSDWAFRSCFFIPHYFKNTWLKKFHAVTE